MIGNLNAIFTTLLLTTVLVIAEHSSANSSKYDVAPNEKTGNIVESLQGQNVNPEELGSYFEGDIMIDPHQTARNALAGVVLWDNAVVPYVVDDSFSFEGLTIIQWAMRKFQQKTCIRFRPKANDDVDYIYITNNKTGCWSYVGKQGGPQQINLQEKGCVNWKRRGTAIHELMHTLGISHEHNRPDRDEFVEILYHNVKANMVINFEKNHDFINKVMPYDYASLMHYSMTAFGSNRKFTLRPKVTERLKARKEYNFEMGQRSRMSHYDIKRLNTIYCHSKRKGLVFSVWNSLADTMFPVGE